MFKSTSVRLLTTAVFVAGATIAAAAPSATPAGTPKKCPANSKITMNGAVMHRDGDTFVMRMLDKSEYTVKLTEGTTIKSDRKGLFRAGKEFDATSIIDGLIADVEGVGDADGNVLAKKVSFKESDLKAAITTMINKRNLEDSITATNEKMDAANAATNERITNLDAWDHKGTVSVYFDVNSAEINEEGRKALDELAAKAPGAANYKIEITGHTDVTGSDAKNNELSERRAEAVVQYLTVVKNVPLRRVVLPMGYGATLGTYDNTTPEGRAKNRRVDVDVFINKGLAAAPSG